MTQPTRNQYLSHIEEKLARFQRFCADENIPGILISSGQDNYYFMDDMASTFKANVYFKEWLPLGSRQNSFLWLPASGKPSVFLDESEDIWHTKRDVLPQGWGTPFSIVEFDQLDEVRDCIGADLAGLSYVGEHNEFELPAERCNPRSLLNRVDFQRRFKTMYEQACVRHANHLAASAHIAARDAFLCGASELQIKAAYLADCAQADSQMPYSIIAGLNEHAAVLHHFRLDAVAPSEHRSFLIDAGVEVNGYASDITRTWAFDGGSVFADLVAAMDREQLVMVDQAQLGSSAVEMHLDSHLRVAGLLSEFDIVDGSPESIVERGINTTFYPHGIGHGLGVNVHELGGQLANPEGELVPPPAQYPKLRNTAEFVAGTIHTVEPGLYFIPALLKKLRESEHGSAVNWSRVDQFLPYGGVRIEDNILFNADGTVENMTRGAFAAH